MPRAAVINGVNQTVGFVISVPWAAVINGVNQTVGFVISVPWGCCY